MSACLPGPQRTLRALRDVVCLHPYSDREPIQLTERVLADAAALWTRLVEAEGNRRDELLRSLSKIELRLLTTSAASRISNPACRAVLLQVFRRSPSRPLRDLLWEAFLVEPTDSELRMRAQA